MRAAFDVAGRMVRAGIHGSALSAAATQLFPASTGQGSLEAARAGDDPIDANGNVISGEVDVQGDPWNAPAWWAASSSLTAWSGGQWMGTIWTGDGWVSDPSGLSSARWSSDSW